MAGSPEFVDAARSIGAPLYVVEGLKPVRFSGCGRSDGHFVSVSIRCGAKATVSIEIKIDRPPPASWPLMRTMPLDDKELTFPLIFEQISTTIRVDGVERDVSLVTTGSRWAGIFELDGRWIGVESQSVAAANVTLVAVDIESLGH